MLREFTLLAALSLVVAFVATGCGNARRPGPPPELVLHSADPAVVASLQPSADAYARSGLPLPAHEVWVIYSPTPPGFVGTGSSCRFEGSKAFVTLDQEDALWHELVHAGLGLGGSFDHSEPVWADARLWTPGSIRPAWVVALIGPGS